ncbi:hypothetical protein ANCDUO_05934 [Ancylostoma duodenale]|uniref:DDE Tnp4 domain-containing protein n=1 Tax=Ancylostoma duodenale TaxID=51022 RepID=A0A0C2H2U6_9BILA|nr:hypothetical protein ANCDUO_05934 [Ancylostoma duodenale]
MNVTDGEQYSHTVSHSNYESFLRKNVERIELQDRQKPSTNCVQALTQKSFSHMCRRNSSSNTPQSDTDIIGCIDGTLVPILCLKEDGTQYMSRKGWYAVNVCVVPDAIGHILYVNSAFPGSSYNSTVWNRCSLSPFFHTGQAMRVYQLFGDCGYANEER